MPEIDTLVLIACVSRKREGPCAARDLYVSPWFTRAREYAEATSQPWFILSAKYGLLAPDRVISRYNQTLNTMPAARRRVWADQVLLDIAAAAPVVRRVVFLAGLRYREFLAGPLQRRGVTCAVPMAGKRIGQQLQWLSSHRADPSRRLPLDDVSPGASTPSRAEVAGQDQP